MSKPNENTVELLVTEMLKALAAVPDYSPSELTSAILTLAARITRVIVEDPTANHEALRGGILYLYNLLPAENVMLH